VRNDVLVRSEGLSFISLGRSVVKIQFSRIVLLIGSITRFIAQAVRSFPGEGHSMFGCSQQISSMILMYPSSEAIFQRRVTAPDLCELLCSNRSRVLGFGFEVLTGFSGPKLLI